MSEEIPYTDERVDLAPRRVMMLNATEENQPAMASLDLAQRSQRIEEKVLQAQAAMRASLPYQASESVKQTLESYYQSLSSWKLHYDFDLWEQAEAYLEQIWHQLRSALCLAMECGLYEEVKAVFLEARHLLQKSGFVKDRIWLASWLRSEAARRDDWPIQHLMTASLVWSYTSCGYYQDLDKASALWTELIPFLAEVGAPTDDNVYREYLRDRQDVYPYNELLVDLYETGTRIALRCARFEEARDYAEKGKAEILGLESSGLLSPRIEERFKIAFRYHEGVIYYLLGHYVIAQAIFREAVERGSLIAWTRLVRGAKSWLATIAIELEEYPLCERILREITTTHSPMADKRDAICHLIRAQLSDKLGEDSAKVASEKEAEAVLKHCSKERDSETARCYDFNRLRLQPMLCVF